jgi:hypothetical protein
MPWEFFLGNAAHRLIAYMYGVNHPGSQAFYNNQTLQEIVRLSRRGDVSKLLPVERNLRPDITDATILEVFEIKPWNDRGTQEGRQEVQVYLAALNRTMGPAATFSHGRNFQGEILVRFARGHYIWRLEWQTTEPGIVQYRWTRSQQRFESEREAHAAGQWVDISEQEMRHYGGWVGQAVEGMVSRREQLATFSGTVGVCIDIIGSVAVGVFSGSVSGGTGAKHPPCSRRRPSDSVPDEAARDGTAGEGARRLGYVSCPASGQAQEVGSGRPPACSRATPSQRDGCLLMARSDSANDLLKHIPICYDTLHGDSSAFVTPVAVLPSWPLSRG